MNKTNDSGKKRSRVKRAFGSSVIFSALGRFSEWIYKKLESGIVGGIFTAYTKEEKAVGESMIAKGVKKLDASGRAVIPLKRKIAQATENSAVLGALRHMLDSLLFSSIKSYGIFIFSASLYSAIAYLFHILYFKDLIFGLEQIIVLVGMLISSVMMISSRHTLASALVSSPIARFVLFGIIGLRTETFEKNKTVADRFNVPFVAGLIFGVLSFFMQPIVLILSIIAVAVAYAVLIKPEFGVVLIFAALPFASAEMLAAAVIYTAVCFFIKVMRGKRSVKIDLVDGTVLTFMLLMAFGGLVSISGESIRSALVYCVFLLGYFLVVNLVRLKEWIVKCIAAVISSCTVVAMYGLYQIFFGVGDAVWETKSLLVGITAQVASTFETPNVLGEYLITVIPLTIAALIVTKNSRVRFALMCSLLVSIGCLVSTWTVCAWVGLLIGVVSFFMMYSRKTVVALIFGGGAVAVLPLILPQNIVNGVINIGRVHDASTAYLVDLWRGVWNILGSHWQSGVGIGEDAFVKTYSTYTQSILEYAPHAHNLYLQIFVELGIVGLTVFVITMFVWAQSCFELHTAEKRNERLYSSALLCSVFSVLTLGITDYVWYDYRLFLMFWLIIGLSCAVRKTLNSTKPDEII